MAPLSLPYDDNDDPERTPGSQLHLRISSEVLDTKSKAGKLAEITKESLT